MSTNSSPPSRSSALVASRRFSHRVCRRSLGLLMGLTLAVLTGLPLPAVLAQNAAPPATRPPAAAQNAAPAAASTAAPTAELLPLPEALPASPVVSPAPKGQYVLEFNRSPVVGTRLRFSGIYDERRLQFTRPRNWQAETVKVLLRYRHSPALYATRSNLTVLLNGTSVGSLPLNQLEGEIGEAVFDVPLDLLQDHNELVVAALQNNSPTCTQDPYDPSLWTEVLPDSKLVFNFEPQPVTPNFDQFPYPLFDTLSLQTNQVVYLLPTTVEDAWLTDAARLQAALGRVAHYRPLDTRLIDSIGAVNPDERLVVIGTPETQPALADLALPFALKDGKFQDGSGKPLAPEVGVLMWSTTAENRVPVLVASGNGPAGVAKAVQFLAQPGDHQIAVGHGLLVNQVSQLESPPARQWPGYLPTSESFQLKDLQTSTQQPLGDVTVRGSHAPALEVDFKALPDDQFQPGNELVLNYSYGPQVNPLTSLVEVELDGVAVDGKRLTALEGADRETLKVALPAEKITPYSRLRVNFRLDPRERRSCSRVTDQQLWGTIHGDSQFKLNRQAIANLPDLKLLSTGFPFTAPQDLSTTAMVLPDSPRPADLNLLLEMAERLGRLSRAESVQLQVFRVETLPEEVKRDRNLIAIGTRAQFPFPEVFSSEGFNLRDRLSRQWGGSQVQALPDPEGVMKTLISPWNGQRVILALSGQDEQGLASLTDLVRHDALFYQIEGDTALVSANAPDADPNDPHGYRLAFLRESPQVQLATTPTPPWIWRLLRANWLLVVPGTVIMALLLYGVAQSYLNRTLTQDD
ncbi:cellulose biosynthesis cyclic di-GMP-binding regulatory protein BcsB [Pseudanabaena sp. FACHB-2040]|uniref:cellulose biosynthesis cyclic di-GMP-binding regulatory protein BcsB n=1 Tax=Pseudanabaena sp. FACHB-2040 TaxID=2692859 RepID=UPI001688D1E8|nr:cellulose biosynthesis cyclic di-GMP-binding regulatory protein BcsB [Pseudanabaena sp. FACHB-2040]MBD2258025.1 cellulose biosynthesis cyclic di-GMP-binding regulatory protein BcsB [Pseudanabaena sp. FACHB-2040]